MENVDFVVVGHDGKAKKITKQIDKKALSSQKLGIGKYGIGIGKILTPHEISQDKKVKITHDEKLAQKIRDRNKNADLDVAMAELKVALASGDENLIKEKKKIVEDILKKL